ncbi:PRC-barrel domain-containing protein [Mucilaginibacter sp. UR6-11]|uniref:PRC-barrel domain-containing protein n=1 Tax=Mucilaginibacter sp. UR6-11 TaxID=1435644 RepID=UPI001E48EC2C|nr:PRC-barrel domain-containing protein [Mucilaginibacter sp. UR6-11]MCC8424676.1 PRC-barrel domain-containing protein [Mucilaginibacter sp. UR6-11]
MSFDNNNEAYRSTHLEELSGSGYEIVDGEPDIKNWDVKNEQGLKIGEVAEMLFDPQARKVRYLVVSLEDSEIDVTDGKNVLIPIGIAQLYSSSNDLSEAVAGTDGSTVNSVTVIDPVDHSAVIYEGNESGMYNPAYDGNVVIIPATAAQLVLLPGYVPGSVSPEMELATRHAFEGSATTLVYDRNGFYNHDYFDVDRFYDRGATTRSNLPVSEGSLDQSAIGGEATDPAVKNPFDASIEKEEPGLGKIGY